MEEMGIIDIYTSSVLHAWKIEYALFSTVHVIFSKTDHMLVKKRISLKPRR